MSDQPLTSTQTLVSDGAARAVARATTFSVILSLSFCHMLNDLMQSLVPALYPILKTSYGLSFGQIGVITLAFQCTASMLQPVVGLYTDRRPQAAGQRAGYPAGVAFRSGGSRSKEADLDLSGARHLAQFG